MKTHQENLETLKAHYATLPRESLLTILQSVVETFDPMDVAEEIEELGLNDPPEPQPIDLAAIQHAGVISRGIRSRRPPPRTRTHPMTPKITDLTEEEINALIAEACGWSKFTGKHPRIYGTMPGEEYRSQIPAYCTSLDAIAIAENALTGDEAQEYYFVLSVVVDARFNSGNTFDYPEGRKIVFATAKQRASAFLLATGKAVQ